MINDPSDVDIVSFILFVMENLREKQQRSNIEIKKKNKLNVYKNVPFAIQLNFRFKIWFIQK